MDWIRAALPLVVCACAAAQDAPRPWRIGVLLWHRSPNDLEALDGIRAALTASGRPHQIEVGEAMSDDTKARSVLAGFRTAGVDLIIALGTEAALACRAAITELPVVYTAVTNPVESGVVAGWEGSGTNLAGNSNWIPPETVLGVFRRAVPSLQRLGVLRSTTTGVVSAAELAGMRRHLADLPPGVPTIALEEAVVGEVAEIDAAVGRLAEAGCEAIWIPIDFLIYENAATVTAAAARHHLPIVSSSLRGALSGAVAGVFVDYEMLGERAVLTILDILEGQRAPGEIPVGTMRGYQVVVNLAAARRHGYDLPLPLIALADLVLDDELAGGGR